jgi:hypothetical protein
MFENGRVRRIINSLFEYAPNETSPWQIIKWWEKRRLAYNAFVVFFGLLSLIIFYFAIDLSGELKPGEDLVEPLLLFSAPFLVNLCYTFGWVLEVIYKFGSPKKSRNFGVLLLKRGIVFSAFIIAAPSIFWVGYDLLLLVPK